MCPAPRRDDIQATAIWSRLVGSSLSASHKCWTVLNFFKSSGFVREGDRLRFGRRRSLRPEMCPAPRRDDIQATAIWSRLVGSSLSASHKCWTVLNFFKSSGFVREGYARRLGGAEPSSRFRFRLGGEGGDGTALDWRGAGNLRQARGFFPGRAGS
ncbi:hypothetical protein CRUP_012568 [Coryphaenoides rupestris]|nr:hypothetical protein CRUP_012568 [Coryphaenoides rupestris]